MENELLIHFRYIADDSIQKAVIQQVKLIGDLDPKELVLNLAPEKATRLDIENALIEFLSKNSILA